MSDGGGVTPGQFRALVDGILTVWARDVRAVHAGNSCRLLRAGTEIAALGLEVHPFGTVWRISVPGGRDRVHESVVAALRTLRGIVSPERGGGRVLFVSEQTT